MVTNTHPIVWVLADERAGNRAQALGLANRLGWPHTIKEIQYDKWVKLPNLLRGASLCGVDENCRQLFTEPWPDLVIGAGRRVAPVARYIKKQNPATKLVQIMWPDAGAKEFDLLLLPRHDDHPGFTGNAVEILGALHGITAKTLKDANEEWGPTLKEYGKPRIAVLIGGSNKHATFTAKAMQNLAKKLLELAEAANASLLITTSRRTGESNVAVLEQTLQPLGKERLLLHRWDDPKQKNPYVGLLACADAIIATGDSVAMTTEAATTGKPIIIYMPSELSPKHARFLDEMAQEGYITRCSHDEPFPNPIIMSGSAVLDPMEHLIPAVEQLFAD